MAEDTAVAYSRVSSKGQVTVPVRVREALGLKAASVPVLLHRARRKLADLVRTKGFGPGER